MSHSVSIVLSIDNLSQSTAPVEHQPEGWDRVGKMNGIVIGVEMYSVFACLLYNHKGEICRFRYNLKFDYVDILLDDTFSFYLGQG